MEIIIRLSTHITRSRERDLRKKEKKYKSKGNEMFGQVDHSIKNDKQTKNKQQNWVGKAMLTEYTRGWGTFGR